MEEEDGKPKDNEQPKGESDSTSSSSSPSTYSSSLVTDLFGPIPDPSKSSISPSTSYFDAFFGPSSTGLGKQYTSTPGVMFNSNTKSGTPAEEAPERDIDEERRSCMPEISEGEEWPTNFTSSIYYGGQDIVDTTPSTYPKKKGDDEKSWDDYATRGDWWKGSYHY